MPVGVRWSAAPHTRVIAPAPWPPPRDARRAQVGAAEGLSYLSGAALAGRRLTWRDVLAPFALIVGYRAACTPARCAALSPGRAPTRRALCRSPRTTFILAIDFLTC